MALYSALAKMQKLIGPRFKKRLYGGKLHAFLRSRFRRELGSIQNLERIVDNIKRVDIHDYLLTCLSEKREVSKLPTGCVVEINNTCNLDCAMCRTSLSRRPKQLMDLELFEKIVEKAQNSNMRVESIHSTGDPLTNRRLRNYLEILRKHNMSITLSSNFQLMEKNIDTIFEFRDVIHTIRPSIDGASKKVYEKIRCGGNWEDLHRGLTKFADRNRKLSKPFHVFVNSVISKDNFHELALIPHVFSYLAPPLNFRFAFVVSVAHVKEYFLQNSYFDDAYVVNAPCPLAWGACYALADGSLSVCCQDYGGELVFGNAAEDELAKCYNNEFLKTLRAAMLQGDLQQMPPACRNCFIVDPRFGELINAIFDFFFLRVKKHPVYLQTALNEIGPKIKEGDFKTLLDIVRSL
jgi:organic radical activating enzyme